METSNPIAVRQHPSGVVNSGNHMNSLTVFEFDSDSVRVLTINGEPWFVARDVLKAIKSTTKVTELEVLIQEDLGDEFVTNELVLDTLGRRQKCLIIAEAALTLFVSRSRTETGKQLNRWIHTEVLPSIRKTGSYQVPQQRFLHIQEVPSPWKKMYEVEFCKKVFSWRGGQFYWDYVYNLLTPEERAYINQVNPPINGKRDFAIHQYLTDEIKDRLEKPVGQLFVLVSVARSYQEFCQINNRFHGHDQLELPFS